MAALRPKGITGQIQLLSVIPLVFFAVLIALTVALQQLNVRLTQEALRSTQTLSASDAIYDALDAQSQINTRWRTGAGRPNDPSAFEARAADLRAALERLSALTQGGGEDRRLVAAYRADTTAVEGLIREVAALSRARDDAGLRRFEARPDTQRLLRRWRDEKTAFDANERKLLIARYATVRVGIGPLRTAQVVVALLGAIATLVGGATLGRRIVGRLHGLADSAQRIAAGEEAQPLGGRDEIAQLDAIVRDLTTRLRVMASERERALIAYEREHSIAAELQRALLPSDLPEIGGVRIHTAYVAAGDAGSVGGDWYDLFELGDGLIGISAGDVAGHGVAAAARMAAVRQSIRTVARTSAVATADQVLSDVNRALCADRIESFVSAVFATVDLRDGTLRYSIAGHPPPIVIGADGDAVTLPDGGTVLGVDPDAPFATARRRIEPGSAMIFYTDGLIEHERQPVAGIAQLMLAAAAEFRTPSENPADGLQRRVLRGEAPHDDSAVLFLYFDALGSARGAPTAKTTRATG